MTLHFSKMWSCRPHRPHCASKLPKSIKLIMTRSSSNHRKKIGPPWDSCGGTWNWNAHLMCIRCSSWFSELRLPRAWQTMYCERQHLTTVSDNRLLIPSFSWEEFLHGWLSEIRMWRTTAVRMFREITSLLARGGFRLTKWSLPGVKSCRRFFLKRKLARQSI